VGSVVFWLSVNALPRVYQVANLGSRTLNRDLTRIWRLSLVLRRFEKVWERLGLVFEKVQPIERFNRGFRKLCGNPRKLCPPPTIPPPCPWPCACMVRSMSWSGGPCNGFGWSGWLLPL
jgi:hypothetical protein